MNSVQKDKIVRIPWDLEVQPEVQGTPRVAHTKSAWVRWLMAAIYVMNSTRAKGREQANISTWLKAKSYGRPRGVHQEIRQEYRADGQQ